MPLLVLAPAGAGDDPLLPGDVMNLCGSAPGPAPGWQGFSSVAHLLCELPPSSEMADVEMCALGQMAWVQHALARFEVL